MVAFVNNQPRFRPRNRVSPKTHTPERQLHISGRRYYNPELGRWPSRDPIGEQGGLHVYGFVHNSPANGWDLFGLKVRLFVVGRDPVSDIDLRLYKEALSRVREGVIEMGDDGFNEASLIYS